MHSIATPLILAVLLMTLMPGAKAQTESPQGLAVGCLGCHGNNPRGQGFLPSLKGLPESQFKAAYADFASGKRQGTVMPRIVRGYSEKDWELLAHYFENLGKKP